MGTRIHPRLYLEVLSKYYYHNCDNSTWIELPDTVSDGSLCPSWHWRSLRWCSSLDSDTMETAPSGPSRTSGGGADRSSSRGFFVFPLIFIAFFALRFFWWRPWGWG